MGKRKVLRPDRPRALIGTALWAVLGACLLFWAVGTQLDFATERNGYLSRFVPGPFASTAYVDRTDRALAAEASAAALRNAEALVLHRPVQSESLTRLARAAMLREDEALASNALIAAAGRGWRDPIAQVAILEGAIAVEDWTVVAQRLAAMRKLRHPRELTDPRLALLSEHPEGRRELSRQLASDPFWLNQFASYGPMIVPADTFVSLLADANAVNEEGPSCSAIQTGTKALLEAHEGVAARTLWQDSCVGRSGESHSFALNPMSMSREIAPFAWHYPANPGVSRRILIRDGASVLSYSNSGNIKRAIAQKYSTLGPGSYVMSFDMNGKGRSNRNTETDVQISILCTEGAFPLPVSQVQNGSWRFTVPDSACEVQRFRLLADRGNGEISNISVDEI